MFNYKQQLVYFHIQANVRASVKIASRPCGSVVSDVPGDSNSSGMSNELNEISDNSCLYFKRKKSSVWTYFGYEANLSEVKEGKRPDIVICRLYKKPVVAKGIETLLLCYPI